MRWNSVLAPKAVNIAGVDDDAPADLADRTRARWRRSRPVPVLIGCLLVLLLFAGCGILAPLIAPYDPAAQDLRLRLRPPLGFGGTGDHPLGTDALGRDILSRLIFGARVSLAIGVAGMVIGLVVGTLCGVVSGFARGIVDDAFMFLVDAKLAIPFLVLMLGGIALLGRSLPVLILLAGLSGWGMFTRLARGMTLKTREQQYVQAAQAVGAGGGRVLLRHVLPNITAPMIVLATLNLTEVIFLESSLSFLGVGVKPPTASWGSMVSDGRDYLHSAWWVGVLLGLAIIAVTMAISLAGDWLRDALDPTLRGTR